VAINHRFHFHRRAVRAPTFCAPTHASFLPQLRKSRRFLPVGEATFLRPLSSNAAFMTFVSYFERFETGSANLVTQDADSTRFYRSK
jgi:hypothetical protein